MKQIIISIFALSLSFVASAQPQWQSLFDGKSFDGWTKMGGDATYEIKGGARNSSFEEKLFLKKI